MKLDLSTVGRPPEGVSHHHHLRLTLSLVAGIAGALAFMLIAFLIIGTVTPAEGAIAYGAAIVLLIVWLTGIWWRWDSPDMRNPALERERRGF
jgi:hypothetical protein